MGGNALEGARRPGARGAAGLCLALVVALAVAAGCGGPQRGAAGRIRAAVGRRFPVLARLPARVTYVVAARRLDDTAGLLRDLLTPVAASADVSPERLNDVLRQLVGLSPLEASDFRDAGFATDRGVALFSTGALPTLLLPVADAAKVHALVDRLVGDTTVKVSDVDGVAMNAWQADPDVRLAWALVGGAPTRSGSGESGGRAPNGWLAVHLGSRRVESTPQAWLEEILHASEGGGAAARGTAAWAFSRAGGNADALGWIEGPALASALRALESATGQRRLAGCRVLDAQAGSVVRRVGLFARYQAGRGRAEAAVELSPQALQTLLAHVAPGPDAGYRRLVGEAALTVSVGADLDWVGHLGNTYGVRGCGVLYQIVHDLDLDEIGDPISARLGRRVVTRYEGAILGARLAGERLALQGAAWLGGAGGPALLQALRFFAPPTLVKASASDKDATRFYLASMGLVYPLDVRAGPGAVLLAMGPGVLARLAGGGAAADTAPRTIAAISLRTAPVEDLDGVVRWFGARAGLSGREAHELSRLLASLRVIFVSATVDKEGLRMAAGFELR